MKEKIINFTKKGKYNKIKIIISFIISIIIACAIVLKQSTHIWDRIPIFAIILEFIFIHFIYNIKDIYEFIYKKRFLIAIIFMVYVVIMGYSGSSIATYTTIIQGEYQEKNFTPILGRYRSIRSDEWSINTPIHISQEYTNPNAYSEYNDNLRGSATDMSVVCSSPIWDISILGKLFNLGYLFLGSARGLSFLWYGKLVFLILVSFEFCMLITKNNKLASLAGMIAITFSAATQWWYTTTVEILEWGLFAILMLDKFMNVKDIKYKLLTAFGLFIAGTSYIFVFYPAWLISYGYIFFALVIWVFLKNKNTYKINFKDIIILLIALSGIAIMVGRFLYLSSDAIHMMTSTDYPGERFELGGKGYATAFSYVYSFLFPYVSIDNPCEYSGFISFFPLPIIVAIIYIVRNFKNKDSEKMKFIIPMLLVTILLGIWTFVSTNRIFAKMTLLYMVPPTRAVVSFGFAQLLILIYMIGNLKKEDIIIKNENISKILAVLISVVTVYMAIKTDGYKVMTGIKLYVCGLITLFGFYEILNVNKEKNKNYIIALLIIIGIVTGTTVNPIQKGISVFTNKPIAKEVQKILKEDNENKLWIVDNAVFFFPNYFLANGAKVLNSTNVYPNFELYKTVFGEQSQEDALKKIYNRYAHLNIEISNENKLELLFQDSIKLYLTPEKVKELAVGYVVSTRNNLYEYNKKTITFEKIYEEYGMYIYKVNY